MFYELCQKLSPNIPKNKEEIEEQHKQLTAAISYYHGDIYLASFVAWMTLLEQFKRRLGLECLEDVTKRKDIVFDENSNID